VSWIWETRSRASLTASATPVTARAGTVPSWQALARAAWARVPRPELTALLAVACALNLWALAQNGWANTYYAAAVRSMSSSWHNFLYASLDPSGVMTVDKPPLALWVQALSARVFGCHPLSLLVPQALMGVASVALTYDLVRRRFGRAGGFVAGLALALTPMTVAVSRHNNPDALLVLCCVAALWCAVRALESGRTRWLVLAGVCVGLGFETKMGVALTVVPGIAAAWLLVAPRGRLRALRDLLAAGGVMTLVGGAWPALVELTPAASRPWVSGTSDNSALSLIFGYNGLGRVDGQAGGPGGGAGGNMFGGSPGPLRLLGEALGGQAGWLLGFALVAALGLLASTRLRRTDARTGWLVATGGAFVCTAALFSVASGIFHPYYVSLLAPFTAALVGAGAGELLGGRARFRVIGPLAVAAGVVTEIVVLGDYPGQLEWLPPLLIALGAASALLLVLASSRRARTVAVAAALALLLIAPSVWAVDTLGHPASGTFPAGGPASAQTGAPGGNAGFTRRFSPGGGGPFGLRAPGAGAGPLAGRPGAANGGFRGAPPPGGGAAGLPGLPPAQFGGAGGTPPSAGAGGPRPFGGQSLTAALSYIATHGGGTLAVSSQSSAASAIITRHAAVAGIGGFSGRESAVSVSWLAAQVRAGKISWVLTDQLGARSSPRLPGDARAGSTAALTAVARACPAVALSSDASGARGARTSTATAGTLYDCQGRAAALLSAGA
jgi:4-amino-4-deoxy-L-arabinose transferase-like glycosyltransferase